MRSRLASLRRPYMANTERPPSFCAQKLSPAPIRPEHQEPCCSVRLWVIAVHTQVSVDIRPRHPPETSGRALHFHSGFSRWTVTNGRHLRSPIPFHQRWPSKAVLAVLVEQPVPARQLVRAVLRVIVWHHESVRIREFVPVIFCGRFMRVRWQHEFGRI